MLILTRRKDQALMIGDVEVRVMAIRRNRVQLAFNAPADVSIHRDETYERIQAEREADKIVDDVPEPSCPTV